MDPLSLLSSGQLGPSDRMWGLQEDGAQQDQTGQFYLVNIRDELPFPGHVDFLVVGPHLALNSEKQHFQVPLLGKPKCRKRTTINRVYYILFLQGETFICLRQNDTFHTAIPLKKSFISGLMYVKRMLEELECVSFGVLQTQNVPNCGIFLQLAGSCYWDLYLGHTIAFFCYHFTQGLDHKSWAMDFRQRARLNVSSKNDFKWAPNITFHEFRRPQGGIYTWVEVHSKEEQLSSYGKRQGP